MLSPTRTRTASEYSICNKKKIYMASRGSRTHGDRGVTLSISSGISHTIGGTVTGTVEVEAGVLFAKASASLVTVGGSVTTTSNSGGSWTVTKKVGWLEVGTRSGYSFNWTEFQHKAPGTKVIQGKGTGRRRPKMRRPTTSTVDFAPMNLVRGARLPSLCMCLAIALSGCTVTPLPAPDVPATSPVPTQIHSGLKLDRSLRAGQEQGAVTLPQLGRLLAATQTGGVTAIHVQLEHVTGPVVAAFICEGDTAGPKVTLRRGGKTLLRIRTDGCDASNLYSGQSEAIGEGGPAELMIAAPEGLRYALVLEEVAES